LILAILKEVWLIVNWKMIVCLEDLFLLEVGLRRDRKLAVGVVVRRSRVVAAGV